MKISPRIVMQLTSMAMDPTSITEAQVKAILDQFGVSVAMTELSSDPGEIVTELENVGTVAVNSEAKVIKLSATLKGKATATAFIVLRLADDVGKLLPETVQ